MTKYLLDFPPDYDEYAAETAAKGWYGGARLWCDGKQYHLMFYDPVRHAQEVKDELARGSLFFEPNLIVISEVSRKCMESAVARLVETGLVSSLKAD